jgi:dTDP-4-amino-4,6-dideoxygalactose transaminase
MMHIASRQLIPIAKPLISDDEKRRVLDVLDSGHLVAGRWVSEFERAFSAYVGAGHGIATSSGTTALAVALEVAGIGAGARVITTPFSFGATANTILHRGAHPVFADIDPRTYNLDPAAVEDILRRVPGVTALLVVHLYGLPCRMDALGRLAREHGLVLLEDAAQAHGAAFAGRRVGTFGAAAAFSFYPSKNLTTGEGGMIVTDDPHLAGRARLLVNGGQAEQYVYEAAGYNYRMTEIAGALGVGQLAHLEERNAQRRQNAARLSAGLADLDWLVLPEEPRECLHVYHQYTVRVPRVRERLRRYLESEGIGTRIYYPVPIHRTPFYQRHGYQESHCREAERAAAEVLSIPVHPALTEMEVDRVIQVIRRFDPRD